MRKLLGYVAGAAFGIAFVATCGNMKGGVLTDMGGSPFDIAGVDLTGYDFSGIDIASADAQGGKPDYTSGSRIKQRIVTTADGASGFDSWYDSQYNVNCLFVFASDQQMRCMPLAGAVSGYYSDAACSMPLAQLPGCNPPPFAYSTENLSTCIAAGGGAQTSIFREYVVGAPYSGSAFYYKSTTTGCTMAPTPPTLPPGYALYAVSATETPPTMFAAGMYSVQ
jgi:hypothetical protein